MFNTSKKNGIIILSVLLLTLLIALCGCKKKDNYAITDDTSDAASQTTLVTQDQTKSSENEDGNKEDIVIENSEFTDSVTFDNTSVGEIKLNLPVLKSASYGESVDKFNEMISIKADAVKNDYLAEKAANEGQENAQPFFFGFDYKVYFADDDIVSLLLWTTQRTAGAAHDSVYYQALNFDLSTGKELTQEDIFNASSEDISKRIKSMVSEKVSKEADKYYPEAVNDIEASYSPLQFVINEKSLFVFFQVYDIAPYAAGVQIFELPFNDIGLEKAF